VVVLGKFLHGAGLDDVCCNLVCVVDEVELSRWIFADLFLLHWCVGFSEGYHPEACGSAFLATYYCLAMVSDLASNHGELYITSCITEFGD